MKLCARVSVKKRHEGGGAQSGDHDWLQASWVTPGIQPHLTLINWPGVLLSLHWATWQKGRPQDSTTPHGMIRLLTSFFSFSLPNSISLFASCQQVKKTHSTELCQVSSNHSRTPKMTEGRGDIAVHCFHKEIQDVHNFLTGGKKILLNLFKFWGCLILYGIIFWSISVKHTLRHLCQILRDRCVLFSCCHLSQLTFLVNFFLVFKWTYRKKSPVDWWWTGDKMFLLSCLKRSQKALNVHTLNQRQKYTPVERRLAWIFSISWSVYHPSPPLN